MSKLQEWSRRRSRRVVGTASALVLAATALAGCAESPNAVAIVDQTTISRDQLEQAEAGAAQVLAGSDQLSNDQVISVLIQGVVAEKLAAQRDITITDGDRDAKLSPAALAVPQARDFVYDIADTNIVAGQIGNQAFAKALADSDVRLNPRYGRWDPSRSVTVIADDGSLSQVLQQPTP